MSTGMAMIPLQLRYEQKAFWRNPAAAFFSFAFPIVLFVLFASIFNGSKESALGGITGASRGSTTTRRPSPLTG